MAAAIRYLHRPPPDIQLEDLEQGKHPAQKRLILEELLAHSPPGEHRGSMAEVAQACLLPQPHQRPSMRDVCAAWPDAGFIGQA